MTPRWRREKGKRRATVGLRALAFIRAFIRHPMGWLAAVLLLCPSRSADNEGHPERQPVNEWGRGGRSASEVRGRRCAPPPPPRIRIRGYAFLAAESEWRWTAGPLGFRIRLGLSKRMRGHLCASGNKKCWTKGRSGLEELDGGPWEVNGRTYDGRRGGRSIPMWNQGARGG